MNIQQPSNPVGKRSRAFYLSMELDAQLMAQAEELEQSVSSLIRDVLQEHFESECQCECGGESCQ